MLNFGSVDFNCSEISPTIFGVVFESMLNPETRRKGGMHYTSIENIHKVIDPLLLDELCAEQDGKRGTAAIRPHESQLPAFREKLASLKFIEI